MDQEHSQLSGINSSVETLKPNSRRRMLKGLAAGAAGLGVLSLSATAMAQTSSPDTAIESQGGSTGYGVDASGGKAAVRLRPVSGGAVGAPAVAGHEVGELYVDGNGSLYYSVKADNAGAVKFRKLASANLATTSAAHISPGSAFLFTAPDRFYDSRVNANVGTYNNLRKGDGTVANSSNIEATSVATPKVYTLYLTGQYPDIPGTPNSAADVKGTRNANVIPAGATAVFGLVAIVNAPNGAVIKVYPDLITDEAKAASTAFANGANSSAGVAFTVALSSNGTLKLSSSQAFSPAASSGFFIDLAGYYL